MRSARADDEQAELCESLILVLILIVVHPKAEIVADLVVFLKSF